MGDLAELELRISSLEVAQATSRMQAMSSAGAGLQKSVDALNSKFNTLNGTIQQFRIFGSFLAAGFIAIRVANDALIETLATYEQTMVTLKAVSISTTDALAVQEKQFNSLTEATREIGQTTRFSAVEAAEGLLTLSKAGFSTKEAISALPSVLNLAQGQLLSVDAAAEIVTSSLRQFGISAVDTTRVVDVISEAANRTSADVTSLAQALKFVGPIASALNKDIEEVSGALGILANSGVQGSLAGTTFRGVLTALVGPTDKAKKAIESLGLTVDELNPATHSIEEIITKLSESFIGTSEAVDIFNKRNAASALILTQNLEPLKELVTGLDETRGGAAALARAQDDTLTGSFKRLSAAYKENVLNQDGFKRGLRATTDALVDMLRVLAGVKDPLVQSNDAAQNLATTLKVLLGVMAALVVLKLGAYFLELSQAIIAAKTAAELFTAVSSINPFVAAATAIAGIYAYLKLTNAELRTTEEEANKIGSKSEDDRFAETVKDLKNLNAAIKVASDQEEFQEAFDLTISKAKILKTELKEFRIGVKNKEDLPESLDKFNDLVDQIIEDPEVAIKLKTGVAEKQSEDLARQIEQNLSVEFGKKGKAFEQPIDKFKQAIPEGRLFLEDKDFETIEKQINKFFEREKAKKHELGGLDDKTLFQAFEEDFDKFFDIIAHKAVDAGELLKIDKSKLFGEGAEVLQQALEETNASGEKLQKTLKDLGIAPIGTEEQDEAFEKLRDEANKYEKQLKELSSTLENEGKVARATAGLTSTDAETKKEQIKIIEDINKAREASIALVETNKIKVEEEIAILQNAISISKNGTSAQENRIRRLKEQETVLGRLTTKEAGITKEFQDQQNALLNLTEANRQLTIARQADAEHEKDTKDAKSILERNLTQLRDENNNTQKKIALINAETDAKRQLVEMEFLYAQIENDLNTENDKGKKTKKELLDSIGAEIALGGQLVSQEKSALALKKEQTRSYKDQSEALKKLVRDLQTELDVVGQSDVEKETSIRLRRIIEPLIDAEDKATKELGESVQIGDRNNKEFSKTLSERLRPDVETFIKSLNQAKKAEQFGRDVAKSFTDPLKEVLKGGSIEDALKSMLERLFDIIFEITIAKPIEDAVAKAFAGSKGVQKFVSSSDGSFVEKEDAEAAAVRINAEAKKLDSIAPPIEDAFETGIRAAQIWDVLADKLSAIYDKIIGKQVPGITPGGTLPPQRFTSIPGPSKLPPDAFSSTNTAVQLASSKVTFGGPLAAATKATELVAKKSLDAIEAANDQREHAAKVRPFQTEFGATPPIQSIGTLDERQPKALGFSLEKALGFREKPEPYTTDEDRVKNNRSEEILSSTTRAKYSDKSLEEVEKELSEFTESNSEYVKVLTEYNRRLVLETEHLDDATGLGGKFGKEDFKEAQEDKLPRTSTRKIQQQVEKSIKLDVEGVKQPSNIEKQLADSSGETKRLLESSEPRKNTEQSTSDIAYNEEVRRRIEEQISALDKLEKESTSTTSSIDKLEKETSSTTKSVDKFEKQTSRTSESIEELGKRAAEIHLEVEDKPKPTSEIIQEKSLNSKVPIDSSLLGIDKKQFQVITDEQIQRLEQIQEGFERAFSNLKSDGFDTGPTVQGITNQSVGADFIGPLPASQQSSAPVVEEKQIQAIANAGAQLGAAFLPIPGITNNLNSASANLENSIDKASEASPQENNTTDPAAQKTFTGELFKGLFGQAKGFIQSLLSSFVGFGLPTLPFERGGVFSSGSSADKLLAATNVTAFAGGGAFTNTIVNTPTVFPLGLMGEAGPEAIMPLKRASTGSLGVKGFLRGKEASTLGLTRGPGGSLGINLDSFIKEQKENNRAPVGLTASKFAIGGAFARGIEQGPSTFSLGNVFEATTNRFESGEAFASHAASGSVVNQNNTTTSGPTVFHFNSNYNFSGNQRPDKEFKRSARQHEADLKDRTRRVFGTD